MIIIKERANKKMKEYTRQMGQDEIGGLLTGKVDKEGNFIIENALLLTQQKTMSTFEIDDEDMMELTKNASPRKLKSIIGWWHSHGNSKTFWSYIDDDCFKRLTNMLNGKCFGIVLANRPLGFHSIRSRLDFIDKKGKYISIDKIKVELEDNNLVNLSIGHIKREIKEKVRDEPIIENIEPIIEDDFDLHDFEFTEVEDEPNFRQASRVSGYPKYAR